MSRGIFGGRRGRPDAEPVWPQPGGELVPQERLVPAPPAPPARALEAADRARAPERELLERIAAFRGEVADALYEHSKDYQILCNLTHADLNACDDIIGELRRRLAGNAHYAVLAKLDEAYALAEVQVASEGS